MFIRSAILLPLLLLLAWPAYAERDVAAELDQVRKERIRVAEVRSRLESQLGELGRELHTLDAALVKARKALREAEAKVSAADRELAGLKGQMENLQAKADALHERMIRQSVAAYQRVAREPGWLDILAGVPVTEIPHRKYMLKQVMVSQQQEREQWLTTIARLDAVKIKVQAKRDELDVLRKERVQAATEAKAKVAAKLQLVKRVRRDIGRKKDEAKQLVAQEKALQQLLQGIADELLASDKARPDDVRAQRGHLPWPLKGKIKVAFNSRPEKDRPKLTGVQLAPSKLSGKGRKVKAVAAGQIRYADWFGGYGLMMIVDHGDGLMTVYAHNEALYRQLGDWVDADEVIAEAGSTGWVKDVRLHFEVRDKGKAVNPVRWCRR